ncbi:MAG: hypothetical protein GDA55_03020 [Cellvibrionales bacterium]|nr:hypothetical protein [Cellvibrionales bacterium]
MRSSRQPRPALAARRYPAQHRAARSMPPPARRALIATGKLALLKRGGGGYTAPVGQAASQHSLGRPTRGI